MRLDSRASSRCVRVCECVLAYISRVWEGVAHGAAHWWNKGMLMGFLVFGPLELASPVLTQTHPCLFGNHFIFLPPPLLR